MFILPHTYFYFNRGKNGSLINIDLKESTIAYLKNKFADSTIYFEHRSRKIKAWHKQSFIVRICYLIAINKYSKSRVKHAVLPDFILPNTQYNMLFLSYLFPRIAKHIGSIKGIEDYLPLELFDDLLNNIELDNMVQDSHKEQTYPRHKRLLRYLKSRTKHLGKKLLQIAHHTLSSTGDGLSSPDLGYICTQTIISKISPLLTVPHLKERFKKVTHFFCPSRHLKLFPSLFSSIKAKTKMRLDEVFHLI